MSSILHSNHSLLQLLPAVAAQHHVQAPHQAAAVAVVEVGTPQYPEHGWEMQLALELRAEE